MPAAKLALRFLILTVARSGEVRWAAWAEIDVRDRIWRIPGERMKAGVEHCVPRLVRRLRQATRRGRSRAFARRSRCREGFFRSDLFERQRRLMGSWAAYLTGSDASVVVLHR